MKRNHFAFKFFVFNFSEKKKGRRVYAGNKPTDKMAFTIYVGPVSSISTELKRAEQADGHPNHFINFLSYFILWRVAGGRAEGADCEPAIGRAA